MRFVPMITKHGSQEQAANAKDAELLTRERLCPALSMFEVVLQKMRVERSGMIVHLWIIIMLYETCPYMFYQTFPSDVCV